MGAADPTSHSDGSLAGRLNDDLSIAGPVEVELHVPGLRCAIAGVW